MADAHRFPTAQEVVDQADLLSPNQYSQEQKLQWLGELEGRIHLDVKLASEQELEQVWQSWPGTLTVGWPHSDIYLHWLLAKLHILKAGMMRRFRRHAFVAILIIAAVITPTTDMFTMFVVALPVWVLYEASILIVRRTETNDRED